MKRMRTPAIWLTEEVLRRTEGLLTTDCVAEFYFGVVGKFYQEEMKAEIVSVTQQ